MGYVLKSDIAVNDPDNRFERYTKYGSATKALYDFTNSLKSVNVTISQSEFNALKTFELGVKDLGVWDNIKEIMPLMGGSTQSVAFKYKGLNNLSMLPVGAPGGDRVNSKGLVYTTYSGGPSSCFNSGFKLSDILSIGGLGIVSYIKTSAEPTASYKSVISGAGITNGVVSGLRLHASGSPAYHDVFNAANTIAVPFVEPLLLISLSVIDNGVLSGRATFNNGTMINSSPSTVTISTTGMDLTKELYVGCNNNNGSVNQSFLGEIRILMVTDGKISQSLIPQFNSLVNSLLVGLGKKF